MSTIVIRATVVYLSLLAAAACHSGPTPDPRAADSDAAPDEAPLGALPEGHPQLPQGVVPAIPPGAGTGELGLEWRAPDDWLEESPTSPMRRAQWRLPGEAGDGECAVFYFGPGQGGDAMANAQRWASQFTLADGRSGLEGAILESRSVGGLPALTVEVAGTYNPGMPFAARNPEVRPGQMLLGAIVEGPDANWFVKCTGPEATLESRRAGFDRFLATIRKASGAQPAS